MLLGPNGVNPGILVCSVSDFDAVGVNEEKPCGPCGGGSAGVNKEGVEEVASGSEVSGLFCSRADNLRSNPFEGASKLFTQASLLFAVNFRTLFNVAS